MWTVCCILLSGDRDGTICVWMAGMRIDGGDEMGSGRDNFMDQGGDEVVSYSPCQSILRLMMLL